MAEPTLEPLPFVEVSIGTLSPVISVIIDKTGPAGPPGSLDISSGISDDLHFNNHDALEMREATFSRIVDDGNSGVADNIDWTAGAIHKSTLNGNCTYTFNAPSGPSRLTLLCVQDGTKRTITWPAAVKWAGGSAPVMTGTAGKVDILTFMYDGVNYYGAASHNF